MQRWQSSTYGSANLLELVSLPVPTTLKTDEVLLRILTTSSTYTDQLILHGNYRPKYPLPVTPGYDAIGIVDKVGTKVTTLQIGDRVAIMPQGGCAVSHNVIPANQCVKIRDDVPPELAITVVLTGVTAYQMIHRAAGTRIVQFPHGALTTYPVTGKTKSPTPNHSEPSSSSTSSSSSGAPSSSSSSSTTRYARILIHSCTGATGSMLVQVAKACGLPASNIYGTCSSKNLSIARNEMGIHAYDYGLNTWDNDILRDTNNEGVDVIFDAIVLNKYYERGMRILNKNGKYIGYGVTNSERPGSIAIPSLLVTFTKLALQNSVYSWFNKKETEFYHIAERRAVSPKEFETDLNNLLTMVKDKTLQPYVGKIWNFNEVKQALLTIETNQNTGRQVIQVAKE